MSATQPLLSAPTQDSMKNLRVDFERGVGAVEGTDITFFVCAPTEGKNLPVILFQSGYGSNSFGHEAFLKKVAAEGFIVIAPDQASDQRHGFCGVLGFLNFVATSALSADGSHLGMALDYAKNRENKWMDRADLNKVTMMGFSMGGQEVIHAIARYPEVAKAAVVLSGSLMWVGYPMGWNCCCASYAGSTCLKTDTPVGACGMHKVAKDWTIPNLWITSENDLAKSGTYRFADLAGGETTLVTFKDSALDLSMPTMTKTSPNWWPFMHFGFLGIPQHFALAAEEKDVSHEPVTQFLKKHFYGGEGVRGSDKMVDGSINSKTPVTCCSPFCLFH